MSDTKQALLARRIIEPIRGCWLWAGGHQSGGYGIVVIAGEQLLVHRVAYEVFVGPIPDGYHIDHRCKIEGCWNPDHLEAVTVRENTARTNAWAATKKRHAAITHCPRGHPYSSENTRYYLKEGYQCRACRACELAHTHASYEKKRKGLWRWGEGKRPGRRVQR